MSFNKFRNAMQTMAGVMISNIGLATTGIVTAIYPDDSMVVKVTISQAFGDQPALQTGWIPVGSPWVGNGFGFIAPPNLNDLVLLLFAEGDSQNPIAAIRIFNDEDVAPNVPSGECWLLHKSGSFIKFTNDEKLLLNGNVEIDLSSPTVKITCTDECIINSPKAEITCTTECKVNSPSVQLGNTSGTLYKLMTDLFIDFFNNHVHTTPSGNSGPPITPATSALATTATEAN